jgi:peptide subunit release factor 1 (eRF1)
MECHGCRMPVLLAFVDQEGERRTLDCPACDHHHVWTVTDVRDERQSAARSSVE